MPDSSLFTLEITRLGGLGDGSGVHEGALIFVPKSCVGDVLSVRPSGKDRAEIVEIITPGKDRVAAPCPHYAECGGCSLQHLSTDAYQQFKRDAVTMALGYGGFPDMTPTFHFLPANSRRRADFKVQNGKLAYLSARSHERVAIENCLILTPHLQALIAPLNALLSTLTTISAIQLTEADSGMDIQLEGNAPEKLLREFAEEYDIARINHIIRKPATMRFGNRDVALPSGAFLQASKEAENLMMRLVANGVGNVQNIVEFFSGLGTYTFTIAEKAKVSAYELDASMVAAMQTSNHPNIHAYKHDLFKNPLPATELKTFHAAVINPPRAGADAQIKALAGAKTAKIVMVSCNPATWSRDAKTLKNAGYQLVSLDAIDQFVYSPHAELVSVFRLPS